MATLSPTTRRRLEIQGFVDVEERTLAETAPWLRLALALCTVIAAAGTALGSPMVLWSLVPTAALAAAFPVHPFDLLYNHGLRHLTGTGPLPRRGAPSRFACGSRHSSVASSCRAPISPAPARSDTPVRRSNGADPDGLV